MHKSGWHLNCEFGVISSSTIFVSYDFLYYWTSSNVATYSKRIFPIIDFMDFLPTFLYRHFLQSLEVRHIGGAMYIERAYTSVHEACPIQSIRNVSLLLSQCILVIVHELCSNDGLWWTGNDGPTSIMHPHWLLFRIFDQYNREQGWDQHSADADGATANDDLQMLLLLLVMMMLLDR